MTERLPRLLIIQSVPLDRAVASVTRYLATRHEGRFEVLLFLHAADDEGREKAERYAAEVGASFQVFNFKRREYVPHGIRWLPWKAMTFAGMLFRSWQMARAAKSFAPDVVYGPQEFWDSVSGEMTAQILRKPHIVHMHGIHDINGRLPREVIRHCAAVMTPSRYIAGNIASAGVRKSRVALVLNPFPRFDHDIRARRPETRASLGIANDALLVGMVADMRKEKRHTDVLHAWKLVADDFPGARLLLVGDGPLLDEVRAEAVELGVDAIIPGRRMDIPDVLGAMDIFFHPSVNDAAPLAVTEAVAAGLPVVAYRMGGVLEMVTEGESGLFAEPYDVEGLAGCLRTLMADPGMRDRMGALSAERARSYTWDDAAEEFGRIVRKVAFGRDG